MADRRSNITEDEIDRLVQESAVDDSEPMPADVEEELRKSGGEPVPSENGSARPHRPMTDLGNAERFVDQHGKNVRYVHPWEKWTCWDSMRWKLDDAGEPERLAAATAKRLWETAAQCKDADKRKQMGTWASKSESRGRMGAMLALAQSMVPITPKDLDSHLWLANTPAGTLNLKTGELQPHQREHYLTKLTGVGYDPSATCPRWEQFLREVFNGNEGLIAFIKRAAGYSLTASTRERCLFFLWGTGKNGKTTFVETLRKVWAEYATTITSDFLMVRKGEVHPTETCDLAGCRLAIAAETEDGRRMAENHVKLLTGGEDKLKGRRMREDYWEFDAHFKLWIAGNHKPRVRDTTDAIWDRILLVPFAVRFEHPDKQLASKLEDELPGILRWAVEGCMEWQDVGLGTPDEVTEATRAYRADEDAIGRFLEDECCTGPDFRARASELYGVYRKWTEGGGEHPMNRRDFGKAMTERGFERYANNGTWYRGVGINEP